MGLFSGKKKGAPLEFEEREVNRLYVNFKYPNDRRGIDVLFDDVQFKEDSELHFTGFYVATYCGGEFYYKNIGKYVVSNLNREDILFTEVRKEKINVLL